MRKSSLSNICKSPVRKLIAEDNQRLRNALNQKREKVTTDWSMWYLADCRAFVCQLAGVGNRFRTADRFQLGMILRTGPKKECLAQANLFTTCKTTWHWFNERPRLVLRNKMLRPALDDGSQWHPQRVPYVSRLLLITCNATDYFNDNWRQAEAWIMIFVGAVTVIALAQGALRRVTQWPWIEHTTFQFGGGHSTGNNFFTDRQGPRPGVCRPLN